MTTNECRCGKPISADRYVCNECKGKLEKALANVPFLAEELETHETKQRAAALGGGSVSFEKALPWHEKAAEARRNLHALLVLWVRFATEEHVDGARPLPGDNLTDLSRWLMCCLDGLTLRDIGSDAVDEITDAVAECRRVLFWKKRERIYLGPCKTPCACACHPDGECEGCACAAPLIPEPCAGEVYAEPEAAVGNCDDCGQGHTVVIRRGELEKQLDDRLCTPAEIARLSTFLGLDVKRDSVRRKVLYWARHKRIEEKGSSEEGDSLYRYGEVRALLYAEYATQEARPA